MYLLQNLKYNYVYNNSHNFSTSNLLKSTNNPIKSLWSSFKIYTGLQGVNPDKIGEEVFEYSINLLISEKDPFTYKSFKNYLKGLCEYVGIIGPKATSEDKLDESLLFLLKQYKILTSMTERELEARNHKYFTVETKKLLAESANVELDVVENTLLHFDMCKTDRKWYLLRKALGRPLPKSYEEREYESYQRPIYSYIRMKNPPTLEAEIIVNRAKESKKYVDHGKPKQWPWFRKPTSGISRWRTRPFTKYLPHHLIKL